MLDSAAGRGPILHSGVRSPIPRAGTLVVLGSIDSRRTDRSGPLGGGPTPPRDRRGPRPQPTATSKIVSASPTRRQRRRHDVQSVVLGKDSTECAVNRVTRIQLKRLSHRLGVETKRERLKCHVVREANARSLVVVSQERIQLAIQVMEVESHLVEQVSLVLLEHDGARHRRKEHRHKPADHF